MVSQARIQTLADRIGGQFHPQKVILFGSYAYGEPTEDSDVDIMVVMPANGRDRAKSAEIRGEVHDDFSLDLLVCDPDYLHHRYVMEDSFVREVVERGHVLYETPHAGVVR